jgi:hypothetical protein
VQLPHLDKDLDDIVAFVVVVVICGKKKMQEERVERKREGPVQEGMRYGCIQQGEERVTWQKAGSTHATSLCRWGTAS